MLVLVSILTYTLLRVLTDVFTEIEIELLIIQLLFETDYLLWMYWSWSQYQHYGHVGQRFLGATLFWSRSCYQSVVTLDNDRGPMPIHKENVTTCKTLIRGPMPIRKENSTTCKT